MRYYYDWLEGSYCFQDAAWVELERDDEDASDAPVFAECFPPKE